MVFGAGLIIGYVLSRPNIQQTTALSVTYKETESITEKVSETETEAQKQIVKSKPKKSEAKTNEHTAKTENEDSDEIEVSTKLWKSFNTICQYPELPNGCEITSLAMLLNYYGFDVTKEELSDVYLDKGEVGKVDFREAFEGNPRNENAYGCYAHVIVKAADKYLESQGAKLRAVELTGVELNDLLDYTDQGVPIMTWCTYKLAPGHYSVTWNVDGTNLTWYTPEHCMVLLGHKGDYVITADPAYGEIKKYSKELFRTRYNELFKQSVIIAQK